MLQIQFVGFHKLHILCYVQFLLDGQVLRELMTFNFLFMQKLAVMTDRQGLK